MYCTAPWLLREQTYSSLYHIQMSSTVEIVRSGENQCLWQDHPNHRPCHWGSKISQLVFCFFFHSSQHWKPLITRILQLGFQTQDNNDVLAYWLSNASTLLLLLQRTLKASGAAGMTPQRRRSSSATLFGRMTQVSTSFLSFQKNALKLSFL